MRLFLILLFQVCFTCVSFAWHAPGHQITAIIAYRSLTAENQLKYITLLESHPYYQKWMSEFYLFPGVDKNEYIFCKASTWPDVIKKDDYPDKHKEWHYINYRVDFENGHVQKDQNKGENVLDAIEKNTRILKNKSGKAEAKAIALSWLIHLVGDISQPMHCAALFSKDLPKGDLGGNKTYVKLDSLYEAQSIHSIWDGLPGELSLDDVVLKATKLLTVPTPAADQLISTPENWSYEGMALAIKYAYAEGRFLHLPFIHAEYYAPVMPDVNNYLLKAKEIADQQLLLGGVRLAKLIERE